MSFTTSGVYVDIFFFNHTLKMIFFFQIVGSYLKLMNVNHA